MQYIPICNFGKRQAVSLRRALAFCRHHKGIC